MHSPSTPSRLLAAIVLALAIACGGGDISEEAEARGDTTTTGEHSPFARVTIPQGASVRAAAESLHAAGLVRWPTAFRAYAKATRADRDIKAGTYSLHRQLSWGELLTAMRRGEGSQRPLTIPEGYTIKDMIPVIALNLGISEDSLQAAVQDTALLRELDIPSGSLEGYLFPDTYRFSFGTSGRQVVREMTRRFLAVWDPAWDARLQELAMTRHDIVTLASIVEKEATKAEERSVIAAVYHNRLRDGMPLQADPTVQYARGEHTNRVLYRDLEIQSPYNTYQVRGLPPGPIAAPGRASIEATLYPAAVPYRFFVAHPDGHHEFRRTFEEHVQARRQIEAVRRERARSAPGSGSAR